MLPKPCLIIVNGHPASGKTTLARQIGKDLGFPVFHRDEFKESLFDNLGWENPELKQKMAITSYKLLFQILEQFLKSSQSLILESNFSSKFDSPQFEKLLKKSGFRVVQIHCSAPPKTLFQRFKKRAKSDRHAGHDDIARIPEWEEKFQTAHSPLILKDSILIPVDTTSNKSVNYKNLLLDIKFATYYAFVERAFYAAGAFAMIFNKQGEILLAHREDRDAWTPPGGIININESPWHAAAREVYEETGLKIKLDKLAGVFFRKGDKHEHRENMLFLFSCKSVSGKLKLSRETSKLQFFPVNKLPKTLIAGHAERIKTYLANPDQTIFQTQKFPTK